MINKSPTALNKRGNKIKSDGHTFDSKKEFDFYDRFVKDCGYDYEVHPRFILRKLTEIDGAKISAIRYTPDFIIYERNGRFKHVYDVKNSFGAYGIDQSNKLRFKLFAEEYGIPVEAVVVRTNDFKVITQGVTKQLNEKEPLIKDNFDYNWLDATRY